VSVTVKICGITNVEDGLHAAACGANALGFVFYPRSPRAVSLEQAAAICHELPLQVARVGVFVDAPAEEVAEAIARCGLNIAQFHGQESPEYCVQFGIMSMKAFRVRDQASLEPLPRYATSAWLLDAFSPAGLGGTGERFDWDLARDARKWNTPIFLAGGLTPDNVAEAIRHVVPFGVDVSSGVEASPGRKDPARVRAFIEAAKAAG
jgi:phosphoribosylanthranilate isomerase